MGLFGESRDPKWWMMLSADLKIGVSGLRVFLLARDAPVCDQAKPVLVQNCYLAVFFGLQAKKSLDDYAQHLC